MFINLKIIKLLKHLNWWFLFLIICFHSNAQKKLTNKEWIEDLRFLQSTIHDDYPFLFKKISLRKFDSIVSDFSKEIPYLQDHEIVVGFARVIASIGYGHTEIAWWENKVPMHNLPLTFYQFKDGFFVQGAHKDYSDIVGAKVLGIEGKEIEKAFSLIAPAIPVENEQYLKNYGPRYLTFLEFLHAQGIMESYKKDVKLTLELDGKVFEKSVGAIPLNFFFAENYDMVPNNNDWIDARDRTVTPLYLKDLHKNYYYEKIQSDALYVRHSLLIDDQEKNIEEFYEEVFNYIEHNNIKKLILDLRLNQGGDQYKNKPIITKILGSENINKVGNLMVIIGRKTFSACMNLVNDLHSYSNAVFVGEPTGENINFYGDKRTVILPHSGLGGNLSFAWWQDKPQWENKKWLAPHISVDMTFAEYKSNQDPILQAAIDFSDKDFIINPIGHLVDLYFKNEKETLIQEAQKIIENPNYDFVDIEDEFNVIANRFAKNGQFEYAIAFHQINDNLFPNSINTLFDLGEVHLGSGEYSKAKVLYQKVISLNTSDKIRSIAKQRLKELELKVTSN
ncbi:hypothetical protein [uncultured Croceitalea sp.]|uniref:hypothetical protein n=1 Tax=uncultured Croceitalea sp. TaxID=1798908 RepID=UPI0033067658